MDGPLVQPVLFNRLDIHDRKQFEIKLEYQPQQDQKTKYLIDAFLFLPGSLNVDGETYPRQDFYADIHNYVRLKTPVLSLDDILGSAQSPLSRLEALITQVPAPLETEIIYQAKLLSCVFRGALRRFSNALDTSCDQLVSDPADAGELESLKSTSVTSGRAVIEVLTRFRRQVKTLLGRKLEEKTRASLRLVDEYMSLTVDQFFRKSAADLDRLPRTPHYLELRKQLMSEVVAEEDYRKDNQLRSVLSPTGDNEEYMHRLSFLKKFCMNILFLAIRREQARRNLEEVLFAVAAGLAMAFATAATFVASMRFPQVSFNFFLVLVVGYMVKDRIKEGLRRTFSHVMARRLFDRATWVINPVTKNRVGMVKEKVDYGTSNDVPEEIRKLRQTDDFIIVSQGELAETVIHYQKQVVLRPDHLPKISDTLSGVTDIIRLNVDRLLRDMDEPEMALEFIDLEELSVGTVKGAKRYQVDLAFRFAVQDGAEKRATLQLVRLVLDRNGIKRMHRFDPQPSPWPAAPVRSVA